MTIDRLAAAWPANKRLAVLRAEIEARKAALQGGAPWEDHDDAIRRIAAELYDIQLAAFSGGEADAAEAPASVPERIARMLAEDEARLEGSAGRSGHNSRAEKAALMSLNLMLLLRQQVELPPVVQDRITALQRENADLRGKLEWSDRTRPLLEADLVKATEQVKLLGAAAQDALTMAEENRKLIEHNAELRRLLASAAYLLAPQPGWGTWVTSARIELARKA